MLGPSFSPSIARIPGPTSSQTSRPRRPPRRASSTRARSRERMASSPLSPGGTAAAGALTSVIARSPRSSPLDLHRARQLAAENMDVGAEAHEQRPTERLLVDHLELIAGPDAALGQEAEHVGV